MRRYRFVLCCYSPPQYGGHRQVKTLDFHFRPELEIDKIDIEKIPPRHRITQNWYFRTIDDLMDADREEWRTRSLDNKISEVEMIRKIRFE